MTYTITVKNADFWNNLTKEETVKYLNDLLTGVAKPAEATSRNLTTQEQEALDKELQLDGEVRRVRLSLKFSNRRVTSYRPNLRTSY